ncbi:MULTISPECIES: YtxH domain-containing protein [unclassified Arthrobacter]|uniref:YtxH domain-containing protein n=1 Tax=unclassified Arthrobacter TaxID=235627 RepID=UPI001C844BFD|nr:YtxH domain-containing protein [Arthrobacter sp. MAHUQ-56]MBX7443902.1 YtxH domain-containing protein [Arthrobacter sp. MAHUQ-56]
MKNKLLLGVGIAAGYVLGSRSGRAAYDKLKARAASIWDSKPVQDKVAVATGTIKEKAPEVADQLGEAARRAGTVIGSAIHRDGSTGTGNTSGPTGAGAGTGGAAGTGELGEDHIPAHSTHPETTNLGTADGTSKT